jgi:hypothetical protein
MGMLATICLSDLEAKALARFCEENKCTRYSAIKIAIRELMFEEARNNAEEKLRTGQTENNAVKSLVHASTLTPRSFFLLKQVMRNIRLLIFLILRRTVNVSF